MISWARRAERASVVDPVANPLIAAQTSGDTPAHDTVAPLKMLSFNIQVGIKTSAYRQYFTKGWKHVLPRRGISLLVRADQPRPGSACPAR